MNRIKQFFDVIGSLHSFFEGTRRSILIVCSLTFVYTLLEGIGITGLIPLFYRLSPQSGEETSRIAEIVETGFSYFHLPYTLTTIFLVILLIFIVKGGFHFLSEYSQDRFKFAFERDLRNKIARNLFNVRWVYFTRQSRGNLTSDLFTLPKKARKLLGKIFFVLVNVTMSLVYVGIAFTISPPVTAGALGIVGLLAVGLIPLTRKTREWSEQRVKTNRKMQRKGEQFLSTFKKVKSSGRSETIRKRFSRIVDEYCSRQVAVQLLDKISRVGIEFAAEITVLVFLLVCTTGFGIGIAELGVIAILLWRVVNNAFNLKEVQAIAQTIPDIELLQDRIKEYHSRSEDRGTNRQEVTFENEIHLENATYHFQKEQESSKQNQEKPSRPVLDNVSLRIKKGQMVGIVGKSGSGKTTVLDLILGLLQPEEPAVFVDGTNLHECNLENWRSRIGYVPQDISLLDETVVENIRFYRDLSDDQVREAAKKANADEFISDLEDGYQTMVGAEGIKLSGGEKQRIALAAALAGNPEVLMLDEATSDLDAVSEGKIKQALSTVRNEVTIISISHRLSAVEEADIIYVLQEGKVAEEGTREELLGQDGLFSTMYAEQT